MTSLGLAENVRQNSKKLNIAVTANIFLKVLNFVVLSYCAWYLANPVPQANIFISIPIYLQKKLVTSEKACAQDTYKLCPGAGNSVVRAC